MYATIYEGVGGARSLASSNCPLIGKNAINMSYVVVVDDRECFRHKNLSSSGRVHVGIQTQIRLRASK